MTEIELIFPAEFDEEIVRERLAQSDSGLALEEGQLMRSAVVDGFTIAGVVVSALSLATTILSLKTQRGQIVKKADTPEPEIRIRRTFQSVSHVLPTGETRSAVQVIEEIISPRK